MEKKVYETPEVTKVEIDFSDRIIAASCAFAGACAGSGLPSENS